MEDHVWECLVTEEIQTLNLFHFEDSLYLKIMMVVFGIYVKGHIDMINT